MATVLIKETIEYVTNPKTGRQIQVGLQTYKNLLKEGYKLVDGELINDLRPSLPRLTNPSLIPSSPLSSSPLSSSPLSSSPLLPSPVIFLPSVPSTIPTLPTVDEEFKKLTIADAPLVPFGEVDLRIEQRIVQLENTIAKYQPSIRYHLERMKNLQPYTDTKDLTYLKKLLIVIELSNTSCIKLAKLKGIDPKNYCKAYTTAYISATREMARLERKALSISIGAARMLAGRDIRDLFPKPPS